MSGETFHVDYRCKNHIKAAIVVGKLLELKVIRISTYINNVRCRITNEQHEAVISLVQDLEWHRR